MAQCLGPRPVCASTTAKEVKETFPEFLRAPWVPAGAGETAAGGEGAGVGCGLGEDRAEHKDTVPALRGPRNPCCCEPGQPKDAAVQPRKHPHSRDVPAGLQGGGQRAPGCGELAVLQPQLRSNPANIPRSCTWRADHIWGARSEVPLQGFAVPQHHPC